MTIYNQTVESYDERMAKDIILLAGRILLESGAEGSRVEDTMTRIATTLGYPESNSFVTNTVINFMLHNESYPRIFRIKTRDTNLHRISRTNGISRRLALGDISLEDAFQELQKIYHEQSINHDLIFKFIAAAVIAASFLYLQGGILTDVLTAILAGSFGFIVVETLQRKITRSIHSRIYGRNCHRSHNCFRTSFNTRWFDIYYYNSFSNAYRSWCINNECHSRFIRRSHVTIYH